MVGKGRTSEGRMRGKEEEEHGGKKTRKGDKGKVRRDNRKSYE